MKKLGEYFADHQKNNRKLVEYVWFGLCFYFGRRGREGWRDLRSNSFCVKKDEDDHEYVCEGVTMKTKNHQGGSKVSENDYSDPCVYDKPFINAFKLYKEKEIKTNAPSSKLLFNFGRRMTKLVQTGANGKESNHNNDEQNFQKSEIIPNLHTALHSNVCDQHLISSRSPTKTDLRAHKTSKREQSQFIHQRK